MGIPLSEAVKAIDANNFAHVATLMKDGSPRSARLDYRDGDDVMISTGVDRIKRAQPQVATSRRYLDCAADAPFPPI